MSAPTNDLMNAAGWMDTPLGRRKVYQLEALKRSLKAPIDRLPYSIKVLLESCLRNCDGYVVTREAVEALANYDAKKVGEQEVPFMPGRVVLQDFTGVPCVVDLAAMRSAIVRMGGDPAKVNPLVPCDLVIDHSVQVDAFGSSQALAINARHEFERNTERYALLKWAQSAFDNFRVVPPATGIVHQVNLEYLAKVVWDSTRPGAGEAGVLYPDTLVGTDSHTTMINGLGVLGWGVGGIEAEAVMLGQPIYMLVPEVVGFRLVGKLPEGATATDLVLTVTQMLRKHGVVGKFVEFCGPGLASMSLATRATIANMAPEYGATCGYFPVDDQTLAYMRLSGRHEALVRTVEQYCKAQGLWRDDALPIAYSSVLELDLAKVEPSLAGPKRPQDRIALSQVKASWQKELPAFLQGGKSSGEDDAPVAKGGGGGAAVAVAADACATVTAQGVTFPLKHGDVVIAAITSCTNTSNPEVMLASGLVAKKARALGLSRRPWVKTSLAPGSKVVTDYLRTAGVLEDLEALGFHVVGYGCTTCIGNSGPLPDAVDQAINDHQLVVASVLSGNRNFEGRVHQSVKANYLASPPLVVAYALAGTVALDLSREPLGRTASGREVYLRDIWPTQREIDDAVRACVKREQFVEQYRDVFTGPEEWQEVEAPEGRQYGWDDRSTYIQEPPFFTGLAPTPAPIQPIRGARCLAKLGDSVTTDHISPAGNIKKDSPAGRYLIEHGVPAALFNSYGARRGNDRVMTRGTFANIRVRNQLAPGTEGGVTTYFGPPGSPASSDDAVRALAQRLWDSRGRPQGEDQTDWFEALRVLRESVGKVMSIYEASVLYRRAGTPLVVLAGKDYGMGSSRDWAAKGAMLLGVRAIIAESFERIHRSNLVGMGVLPLCFPAGQSASSLGLSGQESFHIDVTDAVRPRQLIHVTATRPDGSTLRFDAQCRIDTPVEVDYYRNGGILQTVLRRMAKA